MLATTKQAPDHFNLIGKMVTYYEEVRNAHGDLIRIIERHCRVAKICPSPYWADNTLRAYVVSLDGTWTDYPFASYVQYLLGVQ